MLALNKFCSPQEAAIRWLVHLDSPDITEQQKQDFFAWLEASPSNQAAYIYAEHLVSKGIALSKLYPSQPIDTSVEKSSFSWIGGGALAAYCLLIAVVGGVVFGGSNGVSEVRDFHTEFGEQQEYVLEDGTKIFLNTDSRIEFHVEKGRRIAELKKGEVFFNVKKDIARPFDVFTATGIVRVVGTQFSVQYTRNDAVVTVVEGKVALGSTLSDSDDFIAITTLVADQQQTLSASKKGELALDLDAKSTLAWRQKQLIYNEKSLAFVVEDLSRYFSQKIIIEDDALKQKKVVAVLSTENFDATVSRLAKSLDIQKKISADGKYAYLLP